MRSTGTGKPWNGDSIPYDDRYRRFTALGIIYLSSSVGCTHGYLLLRLRRT